ncbi:MAG TPA: GAF domain-containing protein, partial [Azonexus sp.]|nr:GAF domain-containing protein [Azonexus sp.]
IEDLASDPHPALWRAAALERGYRSCIALPLKDDAGTSFGVLNIYAAEANAFTAEEQRLLNELAGDLAFGIVALRTRAERKLAEEAEHRLNRELHAISKCNQTLMHATDEQALLDDICRIVCDDAGYRMAWVGFAENDAAKTLRHVAWAGTEAGYLDQAGLTWADTEYGHGPSGIAVRTGEMAGIGDFLADPEAAPWRAAAEQRGYRSSIALPLKDENANTFGVLNIYSGEPHAFTAAEQRMLEELAGDLAFGITVLRARIKQQRVDRILQGRLRLLEFSTAHSMDELLTATLDKIEMLTDSSIGFYHFVEADQVTLSLQSWSTNTLQKMCTAEGRGSHYAIDKAGVWVDCVNERRPVIHNDYATLPHRKGMPEGHAPVVREMVVPIFRGEQIKAIIGVGNKATNYDESDIEIASQLGDLSWDIVERKLAEASQQRLNRELRAISNCNQTLMRADNEQALLHDICHIVCNEAGYRMTWVGFAENDEAKTLRPVAWAGAETGYIELGKLTWADTEHGRRPSGIAIRTGEPAGIADYESNPMAAPWRAAAIEHGYRSSISLPLKDESAKTFGVLNIYSEQSNAFTAEETRLLEELAGDLAFGIMVLRARIERNQALELIEKRIFALTRPMEDGSVTFDDLFNREEIQRIQDEFAQATGVASLITKPDGTPLTAPSNFTSLCSEIIRQTERGALNCTRSDAVLGSYHPEGPIVQPCLSGGLWDAGASITVGGHHIANWLIGQVRDETQTEEKMRAYAREIGADEEAYMAAFRKVPAMSRTRFEQVARALFSLANQLSTSAYQNVQQARFITERRVAEKEIEHLAFYDLLTQLPNRRLLMDRLQQAMADSGRSRHRGALLFIDLDNFKIINDTCGHDVGDQLLVDVADRLTTCVRDGDTVSRLGGDEFVVMLKDLGENQQEAAAQAKGVGEKILSTLNQPFTLGGHVHHSTSSIGVTLFLNSDNPMDELLKQADIAMYQAKAAGRNTLRFFDPEMQAALAARADLETSLRTAIQDQQFVLHFQPQVDTVRGIIGAEALVRWQHPGGGMVSPAQFIPLAEETGLVLAIGQWVLEDACTRLKSWAADPLTRDLHLAVNVSARQFRQAEFVAQVRQVLASTGAPANRLKLELTESLV